MIGGNNVKILVLYRSKTGFTLQYAEAIAKEARCKLMELKKCNLATINQYDLIIYGGGIYASNIKGYKKLKKLYDKSNCKGLVLFAVGATPKDDYATIEKMWRQNINENELKKIPHFYMQGGIDYNKLGFIERKLLKKVANRAYKKKPKNDIRESFNKVTVGQVDPLLRYIGIKK